MLIYILRHADAQDHMNDQERPLSKKGMNQLEALTQFLPSKLFNSLHVIYHSTFLRAKETAEFFKAGIDLKVSLQELKGLEPWADPETTAIFLAQQGKDCLVVGHNPYLEHLLSVLLIGDSQACLTLEKSSLACLEQIKEPSSAFPAGLWTLNWLLSPKLFKL